MLGGNTARVQRAKSRTKHEIIVTQEIIDHAIRGNSAHCMVSDAIKACVPEAKMIAVDVQSIRWSVEEKRERLMYPTPWVVHQYIARFDAGIPIEPFSFKLASPKVYQMNRRVQTKRIPQTEEEKAIAEKMRKLPRRLSRRLYGVAAMKAPDTEA